MFKFEHLKRPLQCSYQTQFQTMKWVWKLSIPLSIISGSNWENPKHIELQPNLPVCLSKKKSLLCHVSLFLCLSGIFIGFKKNIKRGDVQIGVGLSMILRGWKGRTLEPWITGDPKLEGGSDLKGGWGISDPPFSYYVRFIGIRALW